MDIMEKAILRSGRDRLRYTVIFELLLMAMLIPAGAVFFDKPMMDIGVLGAMLSVKAMLLNLVYNWAFDQLDARAGRVSSARSHWGRILHALGFEVSLTITSLPIYVLWLQVSVVDALMADIVITSFVVGYTYVFTLIYDKAFPLVGPRAIRT
ncbi:PACE efflux transporter [Roseovarius pelagicus]|uniref:PACE efflux transporter n=1 Tax=Roseovarius pelagicus TaxID=2980108 RepID=A0ABY6DD08_9RHOB|nr:PACE efflux transporter [Roseovarius pelagicus]UXX84031.1 PACE efflux transporter [Roseovarius pelagicus]